MSHCYRFSLISALVGAALAWCSGSVLAQQAAAASPALGEAHTYVGGSLGQARSTLGIDLGSATDMSVTLLAGYQFTRNLAVEGSILSLGRVTNTSGVAGRTAGYGVAGVASTPIARKVAAYIKFGATALTTAWDTSPAGTLNTTQNAMGLNLGVGLRFEAAKNVDFRFGYDRYTVGSDDPATGTIGNISLAMTYKF